MNPIDGKTVARRTAWLWAITGVCFSIACIWGQLFSVHGPNAQLVQRLQTIQWVFIAANALAGMLGARMVVHYARRVCWGFVVIFFSAYIALSPPFPFATPQRILLGVVVAQAVWAVLAIWVKPPFLRDPAVIAFRREIDGILLRAYGPLLRAYDAIFHAVVVIGIPLMIYGLCNSLEHAAPRSSDRDDELRADCAMILCMVVVFPLMGQVSIRRSIFSGLNESHWDLLLSGFFPIAFEVALVAYLYGVSAFALAVYGVLALVGVAVFFSADRVKRLTKSSDAPAMCGRVFELCRQSPQIARMLFDVPSPRVEPSAEGLSIETIDQRAFYPWMTMQEVTVMGGGKSLWAITSNGTRISLFLQGVRVAPPVLMQIWDRWLTAIDPTISEFRLAAPISDADRKRGNRVGLCVYVLFAIVTASFLTAALCMRASGDRDWGLALMCAILIGAPTLVLFVLSCFADGRRAMVLRLVPRGLEVLYSDGQSRTRAFNEIKSGRLSPSTRACSGSLKFKDGEVLRSLFSLPYWPLLRKRLLEMKPPGADIR